MSKIKFAAITKINFESSMRTNIQSAKTSNTSSAVPTSIPGNSLKWYRPVEMEAEAGGELDE